MHSNFEVGPIERTRYFYAAYDCTGKWQEIPHIRGLWNCWSTIWLSKYRVSTKFCRTAFLNVLKKRNVTAIPLILIPEYGQSNATTGPRVQQDAHDQCAAAKGSILLL